MTRTQHLIASTLFATLLWSNSQAGTIVNVTSNSTWTAKVGSAGWYGTYVFNISAGVTFTINSATTCNTCTFTGGTIVMAQDFTCQGCTFSNETISINNKQFSNQSPGTTFSGIDFTLTGSSSIDATGPISMTNSTFNLSGTSFFKNNGGAFNATNSQLTFLGSSYFTSTSGPVTLKSNSQMIAGNGFSASTAYIFLNMGNTLNIYDNSMIKIAGTNNHYENNAQYTYHGASSNTIYTTTGNTINCGSSSQPHTTCNTNYVYGCATINSGGALGCIALATTELFFSGQVADHRSVKLSWSAGQELNAGQFIVERNTAGADWTPIGTVAVKGYSSIASDYDFTDVNPLEGANNYRIRMMDKDGRTNYSKILTLSIADAAREISIYPNPIIDNAFQVKAPSTGAILVHVFTLTGQSLYLSSLQGQTQYRVNLPATIPHNSYIVIQVTGAAKTQAFTVLNQ